jgi:hypothetical protein
VSALHVAVVAELQQRVGTARAAGDDLVKGTPPAQLLPLGGQLPQGVFDRDVRRPKALVTSAATASRSGAAWTRSMIVSSAIAYGGTRGGRQVSTSREDVRITIPPGATTRRFPGIVTLISADRSSVSPFISAAVSWLRKAPRPAWRTAAHNWAARGRGPVKVAYTPG